MHMIGSHHIFTQLITLAIKITQSLFNKTTTREFL